MAIRLPKNQKYTAIPEGTYIFTIASVLDKSMFQKLELKMQTNNGLTHIAKYDLVKEGAIRALRYLAEATGCVDDTNDDLEPNNLLNKQFKARVEHYTVERNDGGGEMTFINLRDIESVDTKDVEVDEDDIDLDEDL